MVAVEIAWIAVAVLSGWLLLAIVVALVVGRVVRRGNEDARLYGSLAASAPARVVRPSPTGPGDVTPVADP